MLDIEPHEADQLLADMDRQIRKDARDLGTTAVRRGRRSDVEPTYQAACSGATRRYALVCPFDPQPMAWTSDVVADLRIASSSSSTNLLAHSAKLADQLDGASQEVHLLAAGDAGPPPASPVECHGGEEAQEHQRGWSARAGPLRGSRRARRATGPRSSINGGAGFNTNRYYLIEFLIEFAADWSDLSDQDRSRLLDDPGPSRPCWSPCRSAEPMHSATPCSSSSFRAASRTSARMSHKKRIIAGFPAEAGDSTDLDRQLLAARGAAVGAVRAGVQLVLKRSPAIVGRGQESARRAQRPNVLERGHSRPSSRTTTSATGFCTSWRGRLGRPTT